MMKYTVALIFAVCMQVSATALSQKVSFTVRNAKLESVFNEIRRQTGYNFLYKNEVLETAVPVSASFRSLPVEVALKELFKGQKMTFDILDKTILVKKEAAPKSESKKPVSINELRNTIPFTVLKGNLDVLSHRILGKGRETNVTVRGKVSDEKGEGLPGVSIVQKGTQKGTSTDGTGNFSMEVTDERAILIFSFVGYFSQEITVGSKAMIDVVLQEDTKALEEVVVTGYSTQRKKDIVGSISVVDMKTTKSVPAGSAAQALQGQAAGVNVINSGAPGATPLIQVRGVSSFGNNNPLVLIDGIEGNLNNISADDIESIQVLKDAGAAAIYGVRGANGVVIVTTNKGKSGKPVLSYQTYYGIQSPISGNPLNLLNSNDFMTIVNRANPSNQLFAKGMPDYMYAGPGVSGVAMAGDPAVDPSLYYMDPINTTSNYLIQAVNKKGTNWFQEVFKPAAMMNHNLSVSGGTDKATYMVSLGYIDQKGTLLETHLKRYSLRVNTEFKLGERFRIGQNANIIYRDNLGGSATNTSISWTYRQMPIIPVYDIMGNFGGTQAGIELGASSNGVATQKNSRNNQNKLWNIMGNIYAEFDILKNLTIRSNVGDNSTNQFIRDFVPTPYNNREGNTTPNRLTVQSFNSDQITWTNTLKYSNTFGKHNISVIAGSEAIQYRDRGVQGSSQGFFSMDPDYLILSNGTMAVTNASSASANSLYSIFSRLDYIFADKYILGGTIRRDGSSKFGTEKRYGVFPSVSLGWRISEEDFLKDKTWITDLKLRGGYGILGSQNNVSSDNAFDLYGGGYGSTYYDITGSSNSVKQGFAQTRIGNRNTGWEENVITNIGLDGSFLQNKIDFSVEYYKKSIKGLLFAQQLLGTVGGATAPTVNIGDIQNTGFDISVGYRTNVNSSLSLSVRANMMTYKNLVQSIPGVGYFEDGSVQTIGNVVRNQVGQQVSSFFGYDVIGLFGSAEEVKNAPAQTGAGPGRFRYRDVNGDGVITPTDRTFLGSPNPDFTYGLNLGLNYKKFDLTGIFYGSQGNKIVNTVKVYTHFYAGYAGAKSNELLNAWTPENKDTDIPILEPGLTLSSGGTFNSYFVENGSFLRLKSMTLGYTDNSAFLRKMKINSVRVYFQASNLFTITKYSGLDPEIGGSSSAFGVDSANYPNQKNYTVGLNLSF